MFEEYLWKALLDIEDCFFGIYSMTDPMRSATSILEVWPYSFMTDAGYHDHNHHDNLWPAVIPHLLEYMNKGTREKCPNVIGLIWAELLCLLIVASFSYKQCHILIDGFICHPSTFPPFFCISGKIKPASDIRWDKLSWCQISFTSKLLFFTCILFAPQSQGFLNRGSSCCQESCRDKVISREGLFASIHFFRLVYKNGTWF